jgi:ABC-type sulfate transport system permease subunit
MSAAISRTVHQSTLDDANWVRWSLITIALGFMILFLCVPLGLVIIQAFAKGFEAYFSALGQTDMQAAMRLTLLTALITVPLNTVFGVAAAWAITRFEFRGKNLLITLIDLPFSASPVISGLILCCSLAYKFAGAAILAGLAVVTWILKTFFRMGTTNESLEIYIIFYSFFNYFSQTFYA